MTNKIKPGTTTTEDDDLTPHLVEVYSGDRAAAARMQEALDAAGIPSFSRVAPLGGSAVWEVAMSGVSVAHVFVPGRFKDQAFEIVAKAMHDKRP